MPTLAATPAPHPAKAILVSRRLTIRDAAARIEVHEQVLGRQLNGIDRLTPRVRRGLSRILRLPDRELFHQDEP